MRIVFFFYFLVFFIIKPSSAQEKIFVIDSTTKWQNADEFVYYYEDTSKKATLTQIKNPLFFSSMSLLGKQKKQYDLNSNFWYKITITNQVIDESTFVFECSTLNYLEFYILDKKQNLLKQGKTGLDVSPAERAWKANYNAFPLKITYKDTLTIIIKVIGNQNHVKITSVWLGNNELYQFQYFQKIAIQLLFQGSVWLMFFYNLLFFFMVKDRAYLYYSLYIASMALVSYENAYSWLGKIPPTLFLLLYYVPLFVTLLYTQFIRYFLNIPHIASSLHHKLHYWVYFRLISNLFSIIAYYENPSLILNDFLLLLFIIDIALGLWLIYVAWRNSKMLAIYMLLGYFAMTIPLSIAILKQVIQGGADPDSDGIIVQMGVLVELIVFSLGLGYRSKAAEKEKLAISEENRRIIAEQNIVLEQKVTERTQELNQQKEAIEEQNKSIMDNITYAKRIQEAFLPKAETIQTYLQEYFIFFQPRDVVSGDFYFVEEVEGKIVVGAIDCTGHGVSGAFMTMLANEILHNLVDNLLITRPDLLLNELHKGVRQALKQHETDNRDGMDLALISIDQDRKKVVYAGAKNPLIYIQNNELHLVNADKMPIGGEQQEQERIFTPHEMNTTLPTMFYLFSDGYQDQF
ncbi:MAG: hypothetical protein EAZ55_00110, partial [Cytophagales bacterium]